ncbi:MAG: hypothetical protein Fur0019_09160 [Tibeticola sp.]
MKRLFFLTLAAVLSAATHAKLPPPSPEAQAKAAEAKAKAAWSSKVAAFQLCKAQDRAAAAYYKTAKAAGRETHAATATPPCADPGPFVYNPEAATASTAPAPLAAPAAAPAVAAAGRKS